MRTPHAFFAAFALILTASCRDSERPRPPNTPAPSASAQASAAQPTVSSAGSSGVTRGQADSTASSARLPSPPLVTDAELGAMIASVSEQTGEFPSDNFVSNETSYLDVAPALVRDGIRGRAYVGVGPEQNLTYALMMRASVAYVVDIRRQNMLELLAMRAVMEACASRTEFLSRWTGRQSVAGRLPDASQATVDQIARAIASIKADPAIVQASKDATLALMGRLGVPIEGGDAEGIAKVLRAFADKGLELTYSMQGSGRKYPPVRELLGASDGSGVQRSFVATEAAYREIREMMMGNRIIPVVGDFSGDRALRGVAADIKKRNAMLGVFYVSNVEQYLFEGGTYAKFVDNVRAFPTDDETLFLRVWFDQGRAHPLQKKGHRTTSIAMSVSGLLARWGTKPYRSFWEVATDTKMMVR